MNRKLAARACLLGATALVCVFAAACGFGPAQAQTLPLGDREVPAGEQMLLEADTLVYDNDQSTVTTIGGVQIEYGGNRLVADRVVYNRNTRRLMAIGNVEIVEKDGNKIYADQIDVTDDFRDGFVNALRVETTDKTYFAAESGKREGGMVTTLNNGVYTACEPCADRPEKPPVWRIRSQRIIWNGETHIVRFEQPRFEFFGMPIAWLPVFETADPTVKRKSGFLFPYFLYEDERGFGAKIPYYFALSPTYDLTVSATPYSRQGFLGEVEWRQKFDHGEYSLKIAGISQRDRGAWKSSEIDSTVQSRGMIGSKGQFRINPRWTFGWDVLAQTDKNFSNTYDIEGFDESIHRSQIFLTGFNDRNYFDIRAMHFDVQESLLSTHPNARYDKQPNVLPSIDYSRIADEPVAGGQLSLNANVQGLHRHERHWQGAGIVGSPLTGDRLLGAEGASGRMTAEAEWKRSFVTANGIEITPLLAARGDTIYADFSDSTIADINGFTAGGSSVASDVRSAYYRYMATAGMEARWPILFSTASSSHILEPMAQIFVRPDAPHQSTLGIPNEDAQSLVFDAASLFERDKFSGYDRIEGGTRANLGIRYSGSYGNGWSFNGLFGQSYHLLGDNPYAQPDLVNVGAYSGLETDVSDYVGLVGVQSPIGLSGSLGMRFDEKTFSTRRTDVAVNYASRPFSGRVQYSYIEAQPLYGDENDRREINAFSTVRFLENWNVFGGGSYDLESRTLTRRTIGFGYADECFIFSIGYTRLENAQTKETTDSVGFHLTMRTIGDFGSTSGQFVQQD